MIPHMHKKSGPRPLEKWYPERGSNPRHDCSLVVEGKGNTKSESGQWTPKRTRQLQNDPILSEVLRLWDQLTDEAKRSILSVVTCGKGDSE